MSYSAPMTLRELHARLGEIIAENEQRGWGERNDSPMYVCVQQEKTPTGRLRRDKFIPIHFACSAWVGLRDGEKLINCVALEANRKAPGWIE